MFIRKISENFLSYTAKTTISIQFLLIFIFIPLILIIYRRISFTKKQLKSLDKYFVSLYQEYCVCRQRLFSEIPKYIISQKGLIIIGNLNHRILNENEFNRIIVKRINLGRFGKKCKVEIYQDSHKITSIKYERMYPEEVNFLINNIRQIHHNIAITNRL